ncbi:MAG: sensor histidine kinase [Acidobacteria bacterium]|nr:sensor histidine kinase [Acidobacteriota bacterium]
MSLSTTTASLRPPWLARLSARQWTSVDYAVAALFTGGALVHVLVLPRFPSNVALAYPLWILAPIYLFATVPIALRRRWPVTTLTFTASAVAVSTFLGHPLAPAPLIALPLYSVTLAHPRRQSFTALLLVEGSLLFAVALAWVLGRHLGDVTFNFFLALATWFVADSIRTRRTYQRGLLEQREERQRLEIEEARRAIVEERMAIARELHDVVAHSLSVIAIQSGVGRHVLDTQPDEARKALAAVESTSRAALEELRGVLGVLRRGDDGAGVTTPAPSLDDLDELIERISAAGVPVQLRVVGEARTLSQGLELSLYRIIQEALTNVVKHAASAPTTVEVTYLVDEVRVDVRNTAPVAPGPTGGDTTVNRAGHGIIGMTERARSFGGSLRAGARDEGGFLVSARLRTKDPS